jgi:isopenicillin N synthase-like dioxygenase
MQDEMATSSRLHASNREFQRFDQVEKAHCYRLAEHSSDEFDEDYRIATLDFDSFLNGGREDREAFAKDFASALEEIGFAIIVGHGVEPWLYEDMADVTLDLFTSTPIEEKLRFRAKRHGSVSQGYFPIEQTSEIHPDLVEGWVFCRRAFDVPQDRHTSFDPTEFWPSPSYEKEFRRLVLAHERLFRPIASAMLQGLGCDPLLLDRKLERTNFGLRLNFYPPMSAEQDRSGAGRLLGHEDVDLFTILPASRTDGLQVWNHQSGKWVRLAAPPGSIIINTGDYMQRLTNDRFPSTTHRVGKPTNGSHLSEPRLSFPTNVYLWEDEMLEVLQGLGEPRYDPIKAIAFHTRSTSKFYGDGYAVEED